MNYTEFLENNIEVFIEIYSLYKSKKTVISKNKLDKSRLKISATRLNLTRGREKHSKKQKSDQQIIALATKSARRILAKKLMNKNYDELNDNERIEFAKRKKNKKELYDRIVDDEYKNLKSKYSMGGNKKDVADKTKGR